MTTTIPVSYKDIVSHYSDMDKNIKAVFLAQTDLDILSAQKADLWAQLLETPGFKPGRSNLEQDAKMRAAYPDFMDAYEAKVNDANSTRLALDLSRNNLGMIKDMLKLGLILVAVQEDESY